MPTSHAIKSGGSVAGTPPTTRAIAGQVGGHRPGHGLPIPAHEAHAQGAEGAEAKVVGRASANAKEDSAHAATGGGGDQLSGPDGSGPERISEDVRKQAKPAHACHLDHGQRASRAGQGRPKDAKFVLWYAIYGYNGDGPLDGCSAGPRRAEGDQGAARRSREDRRKALSAVGERAGVDAPSRAGGRQGSRDHIASRDGRDRIPELVEGGQDAHGLPCYTRGGSVCNSTRTGDHRAVDRTPSTVITSASVSRLDIPLRTPFGISGGMLETATNALFSVELANGTRGYGEAAPFPAYNGETQDAALAALSAAARSLPGSEASGWRALAAGFRSGAGAGCGSAQCALETALLDALARSEGISLWRYFGCAETDLRTDMTITTGSPEEASHAARQIRSRGIRTIKVKVGGPKGVDADLRRIDAILEAAPGSPLILDGNAAMTRSQASGLVRGLAQRGITPALLEQWLPRDDLDGMRALGVESGFRIAADESVSSAADAIRVIDARAAGVINVKLMKAGIAEALAVAALARASGIGLMIGGNVESVLAMTVSACFSAGGGGFEFADLDTPFFMAENPFEGGYEVEGDRVSVAKIPLGHGVTPRGLLL